MRKMVPGEKKGAAKGFKLGWRAFGKISAVEGIQLSPEMLKDLTEFDRKGLSPGDRRKVIARKYGTVRA